ncbi:MAG: hypothetical protein ACO3FE_10360, partial [Planctomycetaceae bacterium]
GRHRQSLRFCDFSCALKASLEPVEQKKLPKLPFYPREILEVNESVSEKLETKWVPSFCVLWGGGHGDLLK